MIALLSAACTRGADARTSPSPISSGLSGGTLRVGFANPYYGIALDPQESGGNAEWELLRCCLTRTLLSYNGRPVGRGGSLVRPDAASSIPTVSSDGLTWTFHLQRGLHYAPPLADVEITSSDFVRALEREARFGVSPFPSYYSMIAGYTDYSKGRAGSISGLSTPDPFTLVVRLVRPQGDLDYRMSLPLTAPIPPKPGDPAASFGVAEGHRFNDGPFAVSSGPYMLEGAGQVDLRLPAGEQQAPSGYHQIGSGPGAKYGLPDSFLLVRNPSWDPSTDDLRAAYPDRIVGTIDTDLGELERSVEAGSLDVVLDASVPNVIAGRYRASAPDRLRTFPFSQITYISMNLAMPPFDDVHVRRAANLVVDRTAIVRLLDPTIAGLPATHIAPDPLENDLLAGDVLYQTGGDLSAARKEMARSRYGNPAGMCVSRVCRGIVAVYNGAGHCGDLGRHAGDVARSIASDLRQIGLVLRLDHAPCSSSYALIADPRGHVPLGLTPGWVYDYTNGGSFFPILFGRSSLGTYDYSLLGATPRQLRDWGYAVRTVPSVDDRIAACSRITGLPQISCWAGLDTYLMGTVVPWIPYDVPSTTVLLSDRVTRFSWDQFTSLGAIDRIAVEPARQ